MGTRSKYSDNLQKDQRTRYTHFLEITPPTFRCNQTISDGHLIRSVPVWLLLLLLQWLLLFQPQQIALEPQKLLTFLPRLTLIHSIRSEQLLFSVKRGFFRTVGGVVWLPQLLPTRDKWTTTRTRHKRKGENHNAQKVVVVVVYNNRRSSVKGRVKCLIHNSKGEISLMYSLIITFFFIYLFIYFHPLSVFIGPCLLMRWCSLPRGQVLLIHT